MKSKRARVNALAMMDDFLRKNINDEGIFINDWLAMGVPDCYDNDDLEFIANDEKSYIECLESFVRCMFYDAENREEE